MDYQKHIFSIWIRRLNMAEKDIAMQYVDRLRSEEFASRLSEQFPFPKPLRETICAYLPFSALLSLKNTCSLWHDLISQRMDVRGALDHHSF
jgi:hypothetical protein